MSRVFIEPRMGSLTPLLSTQTISQAIAMSSQSRSIPLCIDGYLHSEVLNDHAKRLRAGPQPTVLVKSPSSNNLTKLRRASASFTNVVKTRYASSLPIPQTLIDEKSIEGNVQPQPLPLTRNELNTLRSTCPKSSTGSSPTSPATNATPSASSARPGTTPLKPPSTTSYKSVPPLASPSLYANCLALRNTVRECVG